MTPQLQEQLATWFQATAEKIENFATTEIPPFIHEYLQWKFYENVFDIAMWFLLLIPCGVIVHYAIKFGKRFHDESGGASWFVAGIPIFVLTIIMLCNYPTQNIKDCIQISIAPKIFLLERASDLVKDKH